MPFLQNELVLRKGRQKAALASHLLLCWAKHVRGVKINVGQAPYMSGILENLAAATNLCSMKLDCGYSLLNAAWADLLLSRMGPVSALSVEGLFLPSLLPETLTELSVLVGRYCATKDDYPEGYEDVQADALLLRLGRLVNLQRLTIHFSQEVAVGLTCPMPLHRLDRLLLRFTFPSQGGLLGLQWVHCQPVQVLDVNVDLTGSTVIEHALLVQHLAGLRLDTLSLLLREAFSTAVQALWSTCTVRALHLRPFSAKVWNTDADALQSLPHSASELMIDCMLTVWPLHVAWSALTRRALHIRIIMSVASAGDPYGLHLDGECDLARIHGLQQPWQLIVCSKGWVHGWPGAQAVNGVYMLRNAAAQAAGWTADVEDP